MSLDTSTASKVAEIDSWIHLSKIKATQLALSEAKDHCYGLCIDVPIKLKLLIGGVVGSYLNPGCNTRIKGV